MSDPLINVLEWMSQPAAPPPFLSTPDLARIDVDPATRQETVAAICAAKGARLGLKPSAGAARLDGAGNLALAFGLRNDAEMFDAVLQDVVPPRDVVESWLRHAMVLPASEFFTDADLRQKWIETSPMTELLTLPRNARLGAVTERAFDLFSDTEHQQLIIRHLAAPPRKAAQRAWRGKLIERTRLQHPDGLQVVLDFFEATSTYYLRANSALIAEARAALKRIDAGTETAEIEHALSTADWVRPLHNAFRTDDDAVRARYAIDQTLLRRSRALIRECRFFVV